MMLIQEIIDLIDVDAFDEALELIKGLPEERGLEGRIINARILENLGEFDKSLQMAEQAELEAKNSGLQNLEMSAKVVKSAALMKLGRLKEALETLEVVKGWIKEIDEESKREFKHWERYLYVFLGVIKIRQGMLEEAIEYISASLFYLRNWEIKKEY